MVEQTFLVGDRVRVTSLLEDRFGFIPVGTVGVIQGGLDNYKTHAPVLARDVTGERSILVPLDDLELVERNTEVEAKTYAEELAKIIDEELIHYDYQRGYGDDLENAGNAVAAKVLRDMLDEATEAEDTAIMQYIPIWAKLKGIDLGDQ